MHGQKNMKFCVCFFVSAYQGICGILLTVSSLPYVEEELQFEA